MEFIILKQVVSKKDNKKYYIIGIPTNKKNIKYVWHFISISLFTLYFDLYDVEKSIIKKDNKTFFMRLTKTFSNLY